MAVVCATLCAVIGAVCFVLGFAVRHLVAVTEGFQKGSQRGQSSNALSSAYIPFKPTPPLQQQQRQQPAYPHQPGLPHEAMPRPLHNGHNTVSGEILHSTTYRSIHDAVAERASKLKAAQVPQSPPPTTANPQASLQLQEISKSLPSRSPQHTAQHAAPTHASAGTSQHCWGSAAAHASAASGTVDSQMALDDDVGQATEPPHAPAYEEQLQFSPEVSRHPDHSFYYSPTSWSSDAGENGNESRKTHGQEQPATIESMGYQPPESAPQGGGGDGAMHGHGHDFPDLLLSPDAAAMAVPSVSPSTHASTKPMRSMWSTMDLVPSEMMPMQFHMQSSASLIATTAARLEEQLDEMCSIGIMLAGKLSILAGTEHRRRGGCSTVQIALHSSSQATYALKFFICPESFELAKALYTDDSKPLGNFLPRMARMHEAGELKDAHGRALPPCIIMQPGDSLDLRLKRDGKFDLISCLKVLCHVSGCLRVLHSAGYVHRDIKPGKLMWMHRTNHRQRDPEWTLNGLRCAAAAGSKVPLAYNLCYAAPEVIKAVLDGVETMKVRPAVDAWALGVVALELLTGAPVFDPKAISTKQIVMMIIGRKTAPWEDRCTTAQLTPLGEVKSIVLSLLNRDAKRRMTTEAVFEACLPLLKQATRRASSKSGSARNDFHEQLFRVEKPSSGDGDHADDHVHNSMTSSI